MAVVLKKAKEIATEPLDVGEGKLSLDDVIAQADIAPVSAGACKRTYLYLHDRVVREHVPLVRDRLRLCRGRIACCRSPDQRWMDDRLR